MLLFRIQINFNFLFQLQCDWAQIQVIVLTNDGNGFGFGISGSRNSGAVVRNIFPGGAADRVRKTHAPDLAFLKCFVFQKLA